MTATQTPQYSESDITVLEGLEPVQMRPGMYTNTESPNHIIQEVIDNSQDEALANFSKHIHVEVYEDGSISVEDDGRGIPVGIHAKEKKSVIELVFTKLHAGGKFNKGKDNAYSFSGGLHGVGVSVTNALTTRLEVTVWREGYEHTITFAHGAVIIPLAKSKLSNPDATKHGTKVRIWPDPKYFESPTINIAEIERYLRTKAILMPGVTTSFTRYDKPPQIWLYHGGMQEYLTDETKDVEWTAPLFEAHLFQSEEGAFHTGEGFDLAIGWLNEGRGIKESFVNLIPTPDGGKHFTGLRAGLFDAVRNFSDRLNLIPKGVKIEADDVIGRTSFILSVKLLDPKFQNQTKDKMTSEEAHRLVQGFLRDNLELWLNDHIEDSKKIVEMIVEEAIQRSKSNVKTERKRGNSSAVLPGKLSDCESKDIEETELFLVEGDSAGGSAKQGRNRITQAILPLRGKLLNTWGVDSQKINQSETISNISIAVGVEPHPNTPADEVDLSRLRYGRICIMADADVDGQHIQVLLLTLFFKHFPALILKGHIWIAQSPLFRVDAQQKKKGEKNILRKIYALTETELQKILAGLRKEGMTDTQWAVSRFKGLGEMNPDQLWETTMNPETRYMLQVHINSIDSTTDSFSLMMDGKNVTMRRDWMEQDGADVVIDT